MKIRSFLICAAGLGLSFASAQAALLHGAGYTIPRPETVRVEWQANPRGKGCGDTWDQKQPLPFFRGLDLSQHDPFQRYGAPGGVIALRPTVTCLENGVTTVGFPDQPGYNGPYTWNAGNGGFGTEAYGGIGSAAGAELKRRCQSGQIGGGKYDCQPTDEETADLVMAEAPGNLVPAWDKTSTPSTCAAPKVCINPPAPCPACPSCPAAPVLSSIPADVLQTLQEMSSWLVVGPGRRARLKRVADYFGGVVAVEEKP